MENLGQWKQSGAFLLKFTTSKRDEGPMTVAIFYCVHKCRSKCQNASALAFAPGRPNSLAWYVHPATRNSRHVKINSKKHINLHAYLECVIISRPWADLLLQSPVSRDRPWVLQHDALKLCKAYITILTAPTPRKTTARTETTGTKQSKKLHVL